MAITTNFTDGCFTKQDITNLTNNFADVPALDAATNIFTGTMTVSGMTFTPVAVTANGAISPHVSANYYFTKAGVAAVTLAAPTATTDDGVTITFTSTTTDQDTVTFTGSTLNGGGTGQLTATFPVHSGASITVQAYQAKWYLLVNNLVVIS